MKKIWTDANVKQIKIIYNALVRRYTDRKIDFDDNYTFLDKYEKIIWEMYDNPDYSAENKKKISSLLYKYFELNKNERKSQHWKDIFKNISSKINSDNENALSDIQKENWIYMDDLKKMIDQKYETRLDDQQTNEIYLLLLIHYCGPLRTSYYLDLPIHHKQVSYDINYLLIPKEKRKDGVYIVYDDKVSNTRTHSNNHYIPMKKILKDAILESVIKFPRSNLFDNITTDAQFNSALKKATESKTNNQIMRVSYETERYLEDAIINQNYAKFARESKYLRHNVGVVMSVYIKNLHTLPKLKKKLIDYYVIMSKENST